MDMITEPGISERLRSAARLEPDRFPRLKVLGTQWAEAAATKLNATYASPVQVEFAALSTFVFSGQAMEVAETQVALVMRSPQWREQALLTADARFADTVSEAAFGGDGRSPSDGKRALTSVGKFFSDNALRAFAESGNTVFADVLPLGMVPDRLLAEGVGEKLEALLAPDNRNFVEFRFRISIGRCEGALRVALPEAVLAPHKRKFATLPEAAPSIVDEAWAKGLEASVQKADMQVRAFLGEHKTTLGDVASFQVGQTIALDVLVDSLLVVECEGQRMFRGRMGRSRDNYMVRIEETIDPTEEFIDDILAD
ncbi:flagellar motor switch protein FliM [Aureimonas jatrophae]|uniref:Flagellar motor switch protein FliM n=2 Tax=Aureimonas jatrophae TaxID=1166073 RepID=A0A1H0JDZ7_9HYPH|nr:flagellar motor switch protein FliM [Aureimonas jatrophae]